ncbi:SBBP repeat-containing protein [Streptomyces antimycoticus]|uniref:SBBP repeat-containing protein n=1 Tax=Streptomyces antimycoticus TaxID=68175 RepID=UPI003440953A
MTSDTTSVSESPDGTIVTVAGSGAATYNRDNVPAEGASLNYPYAVAVDRSGNVYIADYGNHRVRRVGTNNYITTVAGNGGQALRQARR